MGWLINIIGIYLWRLNFPNLLVNVGLHWEGKQLQAAWRKIPILACRQVNSCLPPFFNENIFVKSKLKPLCHIFIWLRQERFINRWLKALSDPRVTHEVCNIWISYWSQVRLPFILTNCKLWVQPWRVKVGILGFSVLKIGIYMVCFSYTDLTWYSFLVWI